MPNPMDSGSPAPGSSERFEDLAARLRAIIRRASAEQWPGWTEEDAHAITAAVREIEAVPEALEQGMREAFAIGREYGHGEDVLAALNREIREASARLARQAWSGGGARDGLGPEA